MANKYELICLDLDGTLLDSRKKVSPGAKEALYKAGREGIHIALLSGRMPHAIRIVEEQIGFSCIEGSMAGTYITMNGRCICDDTMPPYRMTEILERLADKYKVPLWAYKGNNWYVSREDAYTRRECGLISFQSQTVDFYKLRQRFEQEKTGPNKLLFCAEAKMIDRIREELKSPQYNSMDFARSDAEYLEILPKGANKGKALLTICDKLRIDPEHTLAIGDQELDIEMLETAGFGVAMGNATEKIKKIADAITDTNEEDGVAKAIFRYVLA